MRRVVLSATTIAALIATASCTAVTAPASGGRPGRSSATIGVAATTTPPPPTTALSLCRQALPGRDVVSGTWTTVGGLPPQHAITVTGPTIVTPSGPPRIP